MAKDSALNYLADNLTRNRLFTDHAYKALWSTGRVVYSAKRLFPDLADQLNSLFAVESIVQQGRTLISLPDRHAHRAAVLIGTTLVLDHLKHQDTRSRRSHILYFGATVGIRQHLSDVYIRQLRLDSVFSQENLGRGNTDRRSGSRESHNNLPLVKTVYSPSDPVKLCETYRPNWIAIDCGDKNQLPWLAQLLHYAKQILLPVIAWSTNPLTRLVEVFEQAETNIIYWPQTTNIPSIPERSTALLPDLNTVFAPVETIEVQPINTFAKNESIEGF